MFHKRLIGLLVMMVLGLVACGKSASDTTVNDGTKEENRLVYASESEFAGLNPLLEETNVDALLFRGLLRFDENNDVQNDIAQQVDISDDLRTYTFTLKEDILFHDGETVTADDVVFTIESILNDENASYLKSDFIAIDTITKNDANQVVLTLHDPFTPLLDKMTVPILPKHAFEGTSLRDAAFNRAPIGAGPYQFDKWESGNYLSLTAFPQFFGVTPSIEQVIFKFIEDSNMRALQLKTGEVDIALLDPSQVEEVAKEKDIQLYEVDSADYRGVMLNRNHAILKDVEVRKALSYATDRAQIVTGILYGFGEAAYSPLQKNMYHNHDIEKYHFDLDKANELLANAGWVDGQDGFKYKNGEKLAFTITAPITDAVRVNMANYLSESYKKIGADVTVDALDWNSIRIDQADAFMIGWGSPYDADHHMYTIFHTDEASLESSGYNYGSYSNAKVDALLAEGRTAIDEEKRMEIYQQLQAELATDPPFILIAYLDAVYAIHKDIGGVRERTLGHHGSGFLWNVEEWKWNDR